MSGQLLGQPRGSRRKAKAERLTAQLKVLDLWRSETIVTGSKPLALGQVVGEKIEAQGDQICRVHLKGL